MERGRGVGVDVAGHPERLGLGRDDGAHDRRARPGLGVVRPHQERVAEGHGAGHVADRVEHLAPSRPPRRLVLDGHGHGVPARRHAERGRGLGGGRAVLRRPVRRDLHLVLGRPAEDEPARPPRPVRLADVDGDGVGRPVAVGPGEEPEGRVRDGREHVEPRVARRPPRDGVHVEAGRLGGGGERGEEEEAGEEPDGGASAHGLGWTGRRERTDPQGERCGGWERFHGGRGRTVPAPVRTDGAAGPDGVRPPAVAAAASGARPRPGRRRGRPRTPSGRRPGGRRSPPPRRCI